MLRRDPDVESLTSFVGVDGTNTTLNDGRMLINLKPKSERSDSIEQTMAAAARRGARACAASRCICSRCRT